tara:strand:+ start:261 stop:521 length:261 start_codon:yes stop_codon:yes gene_type:complete
MDHDKKNDFWVGLQTLILVATAAGIFLSLGRRDQVLAMNSSHLAELRVIASDLVKSQVLSEANDNNHAIVLNDLKRRLEQLENRER